MALNQRLYLLVKTLLSPPVPADVVVAQRCNVVAHTVVRYRQELARNGWRWPDLVDHTPDELDRLLNKRSGRCPSQIDGLDEYAEALGNGAPVGVLWEDYRRVQPHALSRSQFTRRLRSHRCKHAAPVLPRRRAGSDNPSDHDVQPAGPSAATTHATPISTDQGDAE